MEKDQVIAIFLPCSILPSKYDLTHESQGDCVHKDAIWKSVVRGVL